MSLLAKSKGEVTYKDLTGFHKWFLIVLVSMGSSIIYTPIYLKNVFYEPLMQGLGCTNADLGALLSCYAIVAVITYLPAGIIADKVRMRTLSWVGFGATAVLTFIYAMLPSIQMLYVVFVGYGITTILIWWGTRFKIVRLCCSEDDYASKIGVSYSIYGAAGLIVGLINTAIISAVADASQGIQVLLVFLGALIALLAVLSFIFVPDFKGEIDKNAKLFSLSEVVTAIKHPGVIWACLAYFFVYLVYMGVTYTTPFMTTTSKVWPSRKCMSAASIRYGVTLAAASKPARRLSSLRARSTAAYSCAAPASACATQPDPLPTSSTLRPAANAFAL